MTNYSSWDSKAASLLREAEEQDKEEEAAATKALGLEGGPKGPPTAKAETELNELGKHSDERKEFIDWSKQREVTKTHTKQEESIILEGDEVKDKSVRLSSCEDVTYIVPEGSGVVKLVLDRCTRVKVEVLGPIITSTIEIVRCADTTFELAVPMGTIQVDECVKPVLVNFAERDHVGCLYHQNSPGLSVSFGGVGAKLDVVGKSGEVQYYTRLAGPGGSQGLITDFVRRGEGEFPMDLPGDKVGARIAGYPGACEQPEPEAAPAAEERKRQAELKRQSGNDMFRANDFLQAAMEYTSALELDPTICALYANRSQCWLKVGNHEKALEDAIKCTEVDPSNAKGWFRKGMSLHAMERYPEAIPALLEAEKLDTKNKQIPEAIKMAQLMARKQASGA
jgi:hypothetical protein